MTIFDAAEKVLAANCQTADDLITALDENGFKYKGSPEELKPIPREASQRKPLKISHSRYEGAAAAALMKPRKK